MPAPHPAQGSTRRALLAAGAGASLGLLGGCATGSPAVPAQLLQAPAAALPGTHQQDLRDPASGNTWRIWVQRPAGPAPATGHPVLYVLDGNAAFALAAQLARNDATRPPELRPDAAIVVGIGHPGDAVIHPTERQRDYTPPPPGGSATPQAGGADRLLDFIARELQPRVAQAFPVDAQRQAITGHSFGGLCVLHALFTRPALFTRYAATSPSVWWNQGQVLQTAQQFMQAHATAPRAFSARLQLRVGSLEHAQAAATPARAAVQAERRLLDRTTTLANQLTTLAWPELHVQVVVLPGLDHGSVMLPGLVDALALAQQTR
ncbi:alpha/beta hydrolase [Acidovorax kalamii]|uniref:alpha/beta hydrolase n=1 Tax=Acidovorax kalamii TaxID=2004485 RepID=UPI002090E6EA|nr:alpha/beta hydrolase-fold protein [Acidovorax kalamii]MCO5357196.1 alpha/beta hydrolase-fold protein [Acidovorax kalamii]